jgi:hypothetical protein
VQCSEEIDVWMTSIETYRYRPASELTVIVKCSSYLNMDTEYW